MGQATDYFAESSAVSPVLHYWSLSVEEQFYLVWPVAMLGVLSIRAIRERFNISFFVILFLALIAISAVMDSGNETSAYFNTIARAYQLIAGALLAAIMLKWNQRGRPDNSLTRRAPAVGAAALALATDREHLTAGPHPLAGWRCRHDRNNRTSLCDRHGPQARTCSSHSPTPRRAVWAGGPIQFIYGTGR